MWADPSVFFLITVLHAGKKRLFSLSFTGSQFILLMMFNLNCLELKFFLSWNPKTFYKSETMYYWYHIEASKLLLCESFLTLYLFFTGPEFNLAMTLNLNCLENHVPSPKDRQKIERGFEESWMRSKGVTATPKSHQIRYSFLIWNYELHTQNK